MSDADAASDAANAAAGPHLLECPPSSHPDFSSLYPERRHLPAADSPSQTSTSPSLWSRATGQHAQSVRTLQRCQENVIKCVDKYPMVQTMVGALESVGCPVDLERHISCQTCTDGYDPVVNRGGYDDQENQVFICANNCTSVGAVHGVLIRHLLSMFDKCVKRTDPRNVDHLACTEIRKANLAGCNYAYHRANRDRAVSGMFDVKQQHEKCVRKSSVESLVSSKFVDEAVAQAAVDRVFTHCYNDLEPYGRRARNLWDTELMLKERYLFGYK